jgi:hypothetical protein
MPELDESLMFHESPEAAANRIIREAAPFAATAISTMATDDTIAASVRLRAAQYIIDRNLGPVGGQGDRDTDLEKFLQEINREANEGSS